MTDTKAIILGGLITGVLTLTLVMVFSPYFFWDLFWGVT